MTAVLETPTGAPLFDGDHLGECRGANGDWWFPERGQTAGHAKEICNQCDVREACLVYALGHPDETMFGVWGGMSERERRRLRISHGTGPPPAEAKVAAFLDAHRKTWFVTVQIAGQVGLTRRTVLRMMVNLLADGRVERARMPNGWGFKYRSLTRSRR